MMSNEVSHDPKQFIWTEKYRPTIIDDCILSENLRDTFRMMVESGEFQNLLLHGKPGTGKTTVAKAMAEEIGSDWLVINCSEQSGIDTLRNDIRNFASTVSLTASKKVVILDEFDYANAQSFQPALRGAIEEFASNCRFVFTCNFPNRIIPAIHSRCTVVEFKIPKEQRPKMAGEIHSRITDILENEGIEYKDDVIIQLVTKYFPDFRRLLNEVQRYSVSGKIDEGILAQLSDVRIKDLIDAMKAKKFSEMRKWAVENIDDDSAKLFRKLYDALSEHMDPSSIPDAILILAEYQYKAAFVADQEINLVACLTELLATTEWKS